MNLREATRSSLKLLAPADRRKLGIATSLQMLTGLLDVVGVLLLALFASVAAATLAGNEIPARVLRAAERVNAGGWSTGGILAGLGTVAASFLLLKSIAALYFNFRILRFLSNRQAASSVRLTNSLLTQRLLDIQSRSTHELTYALLDGVNMATMMFLGGLVVAASEAALLAALGLTLLLLDPLVTLASVAYFGIVVGALQHILGRRMSLAGLTASRASVANRELIREVIAAYREIWVLDRRADYAERVRVHALMHAKASRTTAFAGGFPKHALEIALVLGGAALAATQFHWRDATAAIGTVTLFLAAATRVLPSLLRLQQASLNMRHASGLATTTYELVDAWLGDLATPQQPPAADPFKRSDAEPWAEPFTAEIAVCGVSVRYPGSPGYALHDVSFAAAAGSSVALIGPSGAGKSTLADVVLGVLVPDIGSISVSGVRPGDAIRAWPGAIGYVPQAAYVADATVRGNVALGAPSEDIDDTAVWTALRRAQIEDFVRGLPAGIDTRVGENGARLSGGQRQRLGIARALYSEPKLLVLDEATSALDAETEYAVARVLAQLSGHVTLVTVAHRLSTVLNADLVLYLEAGRLVSSGTFADVRRSVPALERQAQLSGL